MGTVYKESYTKPLPSGAEIFSRKGERFARWKDAKGKTHTAKYRNASGHIVKVATGCRDETVARQVLANLMRRAEHVKAEIFTPKQDKIADHQNVPLSRHFDAYVSHLIAKGATRGRIATTRSRLDRISNDCGFARLSRLNGSRFEQWLVGRLHEGMSASARNGYRESWIGFGNWCRRTNRLIENPFAGVPKADQKADPRRTRRAMTEDELLRLLVVARWRPLAECGRESVKLPLEQHQGRRTWIKAPLRYETLHLAVHRAREVLAEQKEKIRKLDRTGRERALLYKMLVLTGLRKAEIASLTVGQLEFARPIAYAILHPADEKNRQGCEVPLTADLTADLRAWLAERLEIVRAEVAVGQPIPAILEPDTRLFNVPDGLIRILNRDLKVAGIAKRDERGRTVDVHAMRHTFGTHLSKGGVPLRTAQAAMRHSDPKLTANVYTDPMLLDVAGALDALPALPLVSESEDQQGVVTGTDPGALVPAADKSGTSRSNDDKNHAHPVRRQRGGDVSVSVECVTRKSPLSSSDNGRQEIGVTGFEPTTSSSRISLSTRQIAQEILIY